MPATCIGTGLSVSPRSGACAQRASGAQRWRAGEPGTDPRNTHRI